VIAHRGASAELPENTLPAYQLALRQRSDMIEIDLHTTRDGVIVVTHDESLERLGGRGEVADATLEEIRRLDAGGGALVPTLEEVLDAFGSRIPFNLELKRSSRGDYPGMEAAAVEAVARRGLLERTLFSSFYDQCSGARRFPGAELRCSFSSSSRAVERARGRGRGSIRAVLRTRAGGVGPWRGLRSRLHRGRRGGDAGCSTWAWTGSSPIIRADAGHLASKGGSRATAILLDSENAIA
jgi:glycerophosphoryl diester phosphodiesterase